MDAKDAFKLIIPESPFCLVSLDLPGNFAAICFRSGIIQSGCGDGLPLAPLFANHREEAAEPSRRTLSPNPLAHTIVEEAGYYC
jgi:hypothetical protein